MKHSEQSALRVLVVEDEMVIAMELEDLLLDLGHEVLGVAGTLNRALRLIEELAGKIDVVVLDANLGGLSAAPVAEALGKHGIPYVVASGYSPEELYGHGFDARLIGKPYKSSEIESALLAI